MSRAFPVLLLLGCLAFSTGEAQSPTLPSDTLEANFTPRSSPGPTPELAPTLPSDTLRLDQPHYLERELQIEGRQPVEEPFLRDEQLEPVRVTGRIVISPAALQEA